MQAIYVIGTCDTKAEELLYVKSIVERSGCRAILVDVGTRESSGLADVRSDEVAKYHPDGSTAVLGKSDRGDAIHAMSRALRQFLVQQKDLAGVIGLGGSGNTALVTYGMRGLDVGIPKVMVSTVASGDVKGYVGPSDIAMMHAVTDVAGINSISGIVLQNAANAVVGMVERFSPLSDSKKKNISLTMFGVTTPCVDSLRRQLDEDYECLVFHATGTGGQSMEKLVDDGFINGVIDITTTEIADFLVGGILPCTEDRLGAIRRTRVPYVGSCGALDMVNFGSKDSVPERFGSRLLYVHNEHATLMRTTVEESRAIGKWLAERLNQCEGPVRFLIPEQGVSALDAPGKPFFDPDADRALFAAIEENFEVSDERQITRIPSHINDSSFASAVIDHVRQIL